jgi:hypothetical protein
MSPDFPNTAHSLADFGVAVVNVAQLALAAVEPFRVELSGC